MNFIVIDLEWNQSIHPREEDVKKLPFEIIEIGAVKLDEKKKITDSFSRMIKPVVYKELNQITEKLIRTQLSEFETGDPFPVVMKDFLNWCGNDYIFCSWGPLDLTELQRNMAFHKMDKLCDGPLLFYDIQKLFSIVYEDQKTRRSLEFAVDYLKIKKDIPFHRAYGDAYYAGLIFSKFRDPYILAMHSYNTYHLPSNRKEEIHMVFPGYEKYISREFPDKVTALNDREVLSTRCYICRKNVKRKIRWFSNNSKHYYSIAYCDIHGYVKSKLRLKKSEKNMIYCIKTTKFVSISEVEKIREKNKKIHTNKKDS